MKSIVGQMSRLQIATEQEAGACAQVMLPPAQVQVPPPNMMNAEQMEIAHQQANREAVQIIPVPMHIHSNSEAKFTYLEVNITSTVAFAARVNYCEFLPIFQTYPHLKQFVQPSIERSIQGWIHPVVDSAIKIALTTCKQIVRKDFSLDQNEVRLRTCAHHMMRNLTAAMAMITCREQVLPTINVNMSVAFKNALLPFAPSSPEMINTAAVILAQENIELACAFIQKTAVEKALPELDKQLIYDFYLRKQARTDGRRYHDPIIITYQTESLPKRVQLRFDGPGDDQIVVYEEFVCNIPGFLPIRDLYPFMPKPTGWYKLPTTHSQVMDPQHSTDKMTAIYSAALQFLENCGDSADLIVLACNMYALIRCIIIARRNPDYLVDFTLLQRAVEGLIHGHMVTPGPTQKHIDMMNSYRNIHLNTLRLFENVRINGHVSITKQVTYCITECREEIRYNFKTVDFLIRNHLIDLPQYDNAVARMMQNGNNLTAVLFAMQIVQLYLIDKRNNIYVNESDLYHITDMLILIKSYNEFIAPLPEGLTDLIETLRVNQDPSAYLGEKSPLGPQAHIHNGIMYVQMLYHDDPVSLFGITQKILRNWQCILRTSRTEIELVQNFNKYVHRINLTVILKSEDLLSQFLKTATQIVIQEVYLKIIEDTMAPPLNQNMLDQLFYPVDCFVKLVSLLIRSMPETGNTTPKLNLLNKVLGIIVGCLLQDHENNRSSFHHLPYHRLLMILYLNMNMADPILEAMNYQVLTAFCHTLRIVKPTVAAGFAYAWGEFISHPSFMYRILAVTVKQKGWAMYATLLLDLLKFMKPFLWNNDLSPGMAMMLIGAMKVFLKLLRDFPEFLCDYQYVFCEVIAANCIQLRNIVLSAFPRSMRLPPDPFNINLKMESMVEITMPPRAVINCVAILPNTQFKRDLDMYLNSSSPISFLSELRSHMQIVNENGCMYNTKLINAVVLYLGKQAIASIRSNGLQPNIATIARTTHMNVLLSFVVNFDFEGRYLLFNAIANQLRYPNSHTHYFSCALLYLFAVADSEAIKEQITKVLFERLIVNPPHPWGLIVTFFELIKNPAYNLWNYKFMHFAPDIKKLFALIACSCNFEPTRPSPGPAYASATGPAYTTALGPAYRYAPGRNYASAPDRHNASAPDRAYASAPGPAYTTALGRDYASAPDRDNASAPGRAYASAPGHAYTSTPGHAYASAPGPAYTTALGRDHTSAPGRDYASAPDCDNTSAPGPVYTTALGRDYISAPGRAYTSAPGPAYTTALGRDYISAPGRAYTSAPGPAYTTALGPAYTSAPGRHYASAPGRAYTPAPGPAYTTALGPAYTSAPGRHYASAPGRAYTSAPGPAYTTALGRDYTSAPGRDYASAPDCDNTSAPGRDNISAPDRTYTSAPGPAYTTALGRDYTSAPGRDYASAPGRDNISAPGRAFTSAPGPAYTTALGRDYTSAPGRDYASAPVCDNASAPGRAYAFAHGPAFTTAYTSGGVVAGAAQ